MYLNPRGALEMEELRISSVSKLTVMISFSCESIKHLIWRLQSNWQWSNTKQTHLEKEQQQQQQQQQGLFAL